MGSVDLLRLDPDDGCAYTLEGILKKYAGAYTPEEIGQYWSTLIAVPGGIAISKDPQQAVAALSSFLWPEFCNDLHHFNSKFETDLYFKDGKLYNHHDLAPEPREELHRLLGFYISRCLAAHEGSTKAVGSINGINPIAPSRDSSNLQAQPRFQRGDRVLCNLGLYWASGKVLDVDAVDPEDPEGPRIPYMIKLDPHTGYEAPTSVPTDDESVIRREICFDAYSEQQFTKVAAPFLDMNSHQGKLRFSVGARVGCRVEDADSVGFWEIGEVESVWPELPPPHKLPYGRDTADTVPYMVRLDSQRFVYVHRDDHTLIRQDKLIPQKPKGGIARRFEVRQELDGTCVKFDHQT